MFTCGVCACISKCFFGFDDIILTEDLYDFMDRYRLGCVDF